MAKRTPTAASPSATSPSGRPPRRAAAAARRASRATIVAQDEDSEANGDASASSDSFDEDDADSEQDEEPTADEDEDENDASDSDGRPAKRRRSGPSKTKPAATVHTVSTGKELWREGVTTGLGPGKQLIIEKPKLKPTGKTPYAKPTIHPNTLDFLAELALNNDRAWLKARDPEYRRAWSDFEGWLEAVQDRIAQADPTVPELPLKDIIFRIYRDVRFSKDHTPYKPHFSAAFSRTGRKGPYAVYYVQVKPGGQSLIAGGLWRPPADQLEAVRADIAAHPAAIRAVLQQPAFRRDYLGGATAAGAVAAFARSNAENALKTKPLRYAADHADIQLLRLRDYVVSAKLRDDEVLGAGSVERVGVLAEALEPLVTYLNSVVMPD